MHSVVLLMLFVLTPPETTGCLAGFRRTIRLPARQPLNPAVWLRANFERTKTRAARLSRARVICRGSNPLPPDLARGGFLACASWLQAAPDSLARIRWTNWSAAATA